MKIVYAVLAALVISGKVNADCFTKAGHAFGFSPTLLVSIAMKESNMNPRAINRANRNKTEDVCLMQVNSMHFQRLERQFGVTRTTLLDDPCICVYTGAWVLAELFESYGKSWETVGMYNAGTKKSRITIRRRYASQVKEIFDKIRSPTEQAFITNSATSHPH